MPRLLFVLQIAALALSGAVPLPKEHFGFTPGDDYKLAGSRELFGYFEKLAKSSDRIRLVEFGRSSLGKPMYVAFLSDPANLKRLDRMREISRRLATGQASEEEARKLAEEGRAIVWIDSGLHASEVAPAQHAPHLAYQMLTGESEELRAIRRDVILMQIPCINPDGLDWIVDWYKQNVGTPYEAAPLPWLYQKYAGHDNNRDWFMINLPETRQVTALMFRDWFPQIVYNQHQQPPFPARIFVPPYAEPLNPNIPAAVMEGINRIGTAMKERFARENKPGVLSYHGFDGWWNGGLRSVPAFHNMHGILTETALNSYGTPRVYKDSDIRSHFTNGIPAREPSIFYTQPWMGGKWGTAEAIEYMLTADFAILNHASTFRRDFLLKSWQMARQAIELGRKGKPFAYVVAPGQWDRPAAQDMLARLALAGIEVKRAQAPFQAGGRSYPEGTYVLPTAQAFRPYLVDLMEPHKYPEIRGSGTGPTKRPYDVAGWTLTMNMGVRTDRIDEPFEARLDAVGEPRPEGVVAGSGDALLLDHRESASFAATADLLSKGQTVRWTGDGSIFAPDSSAAATALAKQYGVTATLGAAPGAAKWELRPPRVGLYQPWTANMDAGWTEYLLDQYKIPHTALRNADMRAGKLRERFDAIVLASQTAAGIVHGFRSGEMGSRREGEDPSVQMQHPQYSGGIGLDGLIELDRFVRAGGTLIALDDATELPIGNFGLSVRNTLRAGESGFYCPGSLLRIKVDAKHPLAFGMPEDAIAFSSGGHAFEITVAPQYNKEERLTQSVARYAEKNLLASGWISGERAVTGKSLLLEARHGQGRVVLFGFRPQFRAQSVGTFKFLLNAIYLASAKEL